jgi:hypothetical protein
MEKVNKVSYVSSLQTEKKSTVLEFSRMQYRMVEVIK